MVVATIILMLIVLVRNVIKYNEINDRLKAVEWSDEDIEKGRFL